MPFNFEATQLNEVILVKPQIFKDNRGAFWEGYKKAEFFANGITDEFVQDNISVSQAKVLRGLHYQAGEFAQGKLVTCLQGKIYDVAVDIRPNSPNFGKNLRVELSEENRHALYIPKGFAHGFVTLSSQVILSYKTSAEYNPNADRGVFWADETLNIDWGIDFNPILSEKDLNLPRLTEVL